MAYVNQSRPMIHQQSIPQQETPKSGWLRRAFDAVREAVNGPQLPPQTSNRGIDTYISSGNRPVNSVRGLNKLCNAGQGGQTKVLTAISNEYYLQLCDEIGNYSEPSRPATRPS